MLRHKENAVPPCKAGKLDFILPFILACSGRDVKINFLKAGMALFVFFKECNNATLEQLSKCLAGHL